LAAGLIVVAGIAAYANSLSGPFIYDDLSAIVENPTIRQLSSIGQVLSPPCDGGSLTSRPVLNVSLAINYSLGQLDVWGYHATNLAIHLIGGLLLLAIARRTFELPTLRSQFGDAAMGLALGIALLWTVHPLQTESVTYVIQRAESLAGVFYFLVLYSVIRGSQSTSGAWWHGLAVVACWLGVAVKEPVITAPLVVLLYDRTFLEDSFGKIMRRRAWLYAGLFASWGFQVYLQAKTGLPVLDKELGTIGFWGYVRTEPGVILYYLRLSLWPHPLCLSYEWPVANTLGTILPGVLVVGSLGLVTAWGLVNRRGWAFLGAWFFLILAPTSSIMPLPQPAFEHRMYLPLASVVALVVVGGYLAAQSMVRSGWINGRLSTGVGLGLVSLAAVAMGCVTFQRNKVYQSELSIWQDTVAKAPHNPHARNGLGLALVDTDPTAAIEQYQEAIRRKPDLAVAQGNWGNALLKLGRPAEALEHYRDAIRLDPKIIACHVGMGVALTNTGRQAEAVDCYRTALRLRPDDPTTHNNLGIVLSALGRPAEAIEHFELALRVNPKSLLSHNNIAIAMLALGRIAEAIEHYQLAVKIDPNCAEAYYNLSIPLWHTGRVREAIQCGLAAARLAPQHPQINRSAAWLLATHEPADGGDPKQAVELAERVCSLMGRRDVGCLDTLAAAYASAGRFDDAVVAAKEAWQLAQDAGQAAMAEDIHMRIQLYRERKPYREPVRSERPRP
jgi:tetratricopeptide (TPR) repeat protein